jgi:hypothetical protein
MIEPLQYLSGRLTSLAETSNASQELEDPQPPQLPEPSQLPEPPQPPNPPNPASSDTDIEPPFPPTPPFPLTPLLSSRRSSTGHQSTSTTQSAKEKRNLLKKFFTFDMGSSEVAAPKAKPPPTLQSYCFSADGKTLILWDKSHVYSSVIPTRDDPESLSMWNWNRFDAPGVMHVAGGEKKVAAISKVSLTHR